ncbi:MAG: hypothetical protein COS92_06070 [Desulfobacterales bacterium CG07_land_8_20_14_0_80_52_14]|nr:MAG: hypothetical protein COX20_04445 [Desulfobacterales bacterium CG23_combo_of_CG06-09_8_20_14_all_52_9]PIU49513.1 MAG: hypothetical protein COS92_06070 [Desulfobacterales bacterium CG07_land_8_20_14_0_80_52_14]
MIRSAADFEYYLYHEDSLVEKGSPAWEKILPLTRRQAAFPNSTPDSHNRVTLGDYFQAAGRFLKESAIPRIPHAFSRKPGETTRPANVRTVRICLKKHGEFYHPAKITLLGDRFSESFVLNVALSEAGNRILNREVQSIERLQSLHPFSFVPRVYGTGSVSTKAGVFSMFLGEWFEGYHEFHLSSESKKDRVGVNVWDETHGAYLLSDRMTEALYRQIAHILTSYYDPITFEEIRSWHHASGDFVVKVENGSLSIRLISVRDYRAMLQPRPEEHETEASVENILQVLLFFFLNLSYRIRMDRISGTGEWIWADGECVGPTVEGFFNALDEKDPVPILPAPLVDCFKAYLGSLTEKDVFEILAALVGRRSQINEEAAFVLRHFDTHVGQLMAALKNRL